MLLLQPVLMNGAKMILTEDEYGVNLAQVEKMEVVEIVRGKIGETISS